MTYVKQLVARIWNLLGLNAWEQVAAIPPMRVSKQAGRLLSLDLTHL